MHGVREGIPMYGHVHFSGHFTFIHTDEAFASHISLEPWWLEKRLMSSQMLPRQQGRQEQEQEQQGQGQGQERQGPLLLVRQE
jgi:hypothetical protein